MVSGTISGICYIDGSVSIHREPRRIAQVSPHTATSHGRNHTVAVHLTDAVVIAVRELRNPPAHAPPHQLVAYMARIATDLHNAEPTDGPPLPVA